MRMLRYITVIVATTLMAVACGDYDSRIDDLQGQIDDLAGYCTTLNSNAEALQAMINAIGTADELVEFSPIVEDNAVVGYRAVFKDAGEVVVYNQNTSISVGEDGGHYYWMVGGAWLKDASGKRVEITPDATVPVFAVSGGLLKVSTDGGTSWQNVGYVDKALISDVTEDEERVIFTLGSGAVVIIPKPRALTLELTGDDATIASGGSVTVGYAVTGADKPEIKVLCGDGWSAIVTPSGTTAGTITIKAPDPITEDKVIVFASDGQGRMVAVQMRLVIDTTPPATVLEADQTEFQVPKEGGQIDVTLSANVSYTVVTSSAWLHYNGTKAVRTDHLSFFVDSNPGAQRRATAIIASGSGAVELTFIQDGEDPFLSVDPQQIEFTSAAGSATVTVTSNVSYSAAKSASWVLLSKSGDVYTVSVQENTSTSERSATVTFTASGNLACTVTITQAGAPKTLEVTPAKLSFSCAEASKILTVKANVEYTYNFSATWLSVAKAGTDRYTVSVEENDDTSPRNATITFQGDGVEPVEVTVTQSEAAPYIELNEDYFEFSENGGNATVRVYSNVEYTVSGGASWVAITPVSSNRYKITVDANNTTRERSTTVVFSGGGVSATATVRQAEHIPLVYAEVGHDFFVSSGNYNYRYGPSIIRNSDGSLDMWTTKEGVTYLSANADLCYQEVGTRFQVDASTHTIAQYFEIQHSFMRVMVSVYGTGSSTDGFKLNLYEWKGSLAATLAAGPMNSETFSGSIPVNGNRYSIYSPGKVKLPAGKYMWSMTEPTNGIGVYAYTGAGSASVADAVSYMDGVAQDTWNYQARTRGSSYNSTRFADSFVYFHSDDGGETWSKERDILYPTENGEDHYSVCDPGVVYFDGWYYIGYTSAPTQSGDNAGRYNHCYVARSRTPVGPWFKWNGSGWGGDPAKIIKFTGTKDQWGAGEPSMVILDDTIYFYYTWAEDFDPEHGVTRLATAPLTEDWPAHLTQHGTVIDKSNIPNADSVDIKYVEDYQLFYAFHTYYRLRSNSAIAVWTSPDGIHFTRRADMQGTPHTYVSNMGVSGDGQGHIHLSEPQFYGYAWGNNAAGNWNSGIGSMTFGN